MDHAYQPPDDPCMPSKKSPPHAHPGHFLREWRKFHDLSMQEVVDKLSEMVEERGLPKTGIGLTHGNLSRIERGATPYTQKTLELLAEIYDTDVPSLIWRKPDDPDGLWAIWNKLDDGERGQVVEIAKTFQHRRRG